MVGRLVFLLGFLLLPGAVGFGDTLELAHKGGVRGDAWELLELRVTSAVGPGGTVTVQDARGGLKVTASIPENMSGEAQRVLIPYPAITPAELDGGAWPIVMSVTGEEGGVHRARIAVPLAPGVGEGLGYRVAAPMNVDTLPAEAAGWAGAGRPVEVLRFTDEELLGAAPLVFCSCDAVFIPRRLTERFTQERAAALAAAGVTLLAEGEQAGLGSMRTMSWVRVSGGAGEGGARVWAFPAAAVARPSPIEPGLNHLPELLAPAEADPLTCRVIGLMPVAALVILLLLRGIFGHAIGLLCAAGPVFVLLAAGTIALVRAHAPEVQRAARWTAGGAGLRVEEGVYARTRIFPSRPTIVADDGALLTPVWPSADAFFRQPETTLFLHAAADATAGATTELTATLGARGGMAWLMRSGAVDGRFAVRSAGDAARLASAPGEAEWWIVNGHLARTAAGGAIPQAAGVSDEPAMAEWAAGHAELAGSVRAWYELRFGVGERYLLLAPPGDGPEIVTVEGGAAGRGGP